MYQELTILQKLIVGIAHSMRSLVIHIGCGLQELLGRQLDTLELQRGHGMR